MKKSRLTLPVALLALAGLTGGNPAFTHAAETPDPKPPSADGKVPREGFDLHYRIYGDQGPFLIVLAGGPGLEPGYMMPVVEALHAKFKCVLLEQRGTGRSRLKEYNTNTIDIPAYLDDLEALRKHLGQEKLLLAGNSGGAGLALSYAGTYSGQTRAIVALAPAPTDFEHGEAMGANMERRSPEGFMTKWFYDRTKAKGFRLDMNDQVNDQVMKVASSPASRSYMDTFVRSRFPAITAPVLLVHGRQDVVPEGAIVEAHYLIKGSQLKLINKCGHFPWLEQPEALWESVHAFLKPFEEQK